MKIQELLNQSRKNKDIIGIRAYSRVLAAIQTARGRTGKELTETEVLKITNNEKDILLEELRFQTGEVKSGSEAMVKLLEALLPAKVDPAQYEAIVNEAIEETQALTARDFGRAIKFISSKHSLAVDMKEISSILKSKLV